MKMTEANTERMVYRKNAKQAYKALIFGLGIIGLIGNIGNVAANENDLESKTMLEKMFLEYDGELRPLEDNNCTTATVVSVYLTMKNIELLEIKQQWKVEMTLQFYWKDSRLQFNTKEVPCVNLPKPYVDRIWKPDSYFPNEIKSNFLTILDKNENVKICPNGDLIYSSKVSLTLSCPMDFLQFPLDKQTCSLQITTGHTYEDLIFIWKDVDPVQITSELNNLNWFTLNQCNQDQYYTETDMGIYSGLKVEVRFSRDPYRSLVVWHLPMITLVVIIYCTFFMDSHKFAVNRSAILAICFFCSKSIMSESPKLPISYCTRLDYWNFFILLFILWPIIEFVIVSYLRIDVKTPDNQMLTVINEIEFLHSNRYVRGERVLVSKITATILRSITLPLKVDKIHRSIYLVAFAIFLLAYFIMA